MSDIESGKQINYSKLVAEVVAFLKSVCYNIDGYKSGVPNNIRNGASFTIASQNFAETRTTDGGKDATHNIAISAHTSTVKAVVADAMTSTVQSTVVTNQINAFLSDRGINVGSKEPVYVDGKPTGGEYVSLKSIMNFYANISSFIASRLVFVTNSFGNGPFLFYNGADTVTYGNELFQSDENFTVTDINNCMQQIMESVTNTSKAHNVITTISYACSSCSSSSSSSCSSSSSSSCSSSSSSSSFFIAYMDI